MKYTMVTVIYNPNSTGSSKQLAERFKKDLLKILPKQRIELAATKHAGHAEEIAYKTAKQTKSPLIISSSGDGGYNEVINGVLKAQAEGAHPTTGLLPAGNANDHYHNLHRGNIVESIARKEPTKIDVLKLRGSLKGKVVERYGHSYIGLGLTPSVGRELNKNKLTIFNEGLIVLKALFSVRSVRLKIGSRVRSYDSIIFSNVDRMSKVLTISSPSQLNDGKFEITAFRKRNKLKLMYVLIKASLIGTKEDKRTSQFEFETTDKPALVQLDGEIMSLDAHSKVVITCEKQALTCVV